MTYEWPQSRSQSMSAFYISWYSFGYLSVFSRQVYYNATLGVSLLQSVLPQQLSIDVPTVLFQRQNNATDDLYSASLVLFVLNRSAPFPLFPRPSLSEVGHRYLNIIGPALGNWQFYSHKFTVESCHKLFLLPTVFRGSFFISWFYYDELNEKMQCFWVWCRKW